MAANLRPEWSQPQIRPELSFGEIHVWRARVDGRSARSDVLSIDEQDRAGRFHLQRDRLRWTAARVLLRFVLGNYLCVAPAAVVFEVEQDGRPFVRWPISDWLSFSSTHSGGLALVAVTAGQTVGVDIEAIRLDVDVDAIARRVLGEPITQELRFTLPEDRVAAFFRAWVREEARGKCRGTGLVEPDDERRSLPLPVTDLEVDEGYAGALAVASQIRAVRLFEMDVSSADKPGKQAEQES
jgi:4'-phosphopantetheinyl transferase